MHQVWGKNFAYVEETTNGTNTNQSSNWAGQTASVPNRRTMEQNEYLSLL